ncbi:uncharacterized protein [Euphorbia lathyris]|uniref:uncharacterized protein n=1 Tax=Euphorbia lathyris TaxID=212925 RepID=UPI003313D476
MLVDADMEEIKGIIEEPNRQIPAEDDQTEVIRELRDLPPLHYLFKIKNFSLLSNAKADNYESTDFEIGGYKWKLSLYPKGNKKVNETKHISLYLVLSESNSFPINREVNVYLKLFVYNQLQDKYLTVQDAKGSARRFRGMKREWGFDQLVPLNVFNDASNGYLINDCCVFGAEVFVLEGSSKGECASAAELDNDTYTWKIENFAEMEEETYNSEEFVIGGRRWTLELHPNGYEQDIGKSLSVFLNLEEEEDLKPGRSFYVEYVLRVRDQAHGKHHELFEGNHFASGDANWGHAKFMPLSKLKDPSQAYMVNGTIILEVQFSLITKVKELRKL